MPSPPTNHLPDKIILSTEYLTYNNAQYKRRKGEPTWSRIRSENVDQSKDTSGAWTLYLVRFNQYPEEPLHWALVFSSSEGLRSILQSDEVEKSSTHILEVRGEPEEMFLVYREVSQPPSLLEDVHSIFDLGVLDSKALGKAIGAASSVEPPRAETKTNVKENCQGWCVRATKELIQKAILQRENGEMKLQLMRVMMEEVKPLQNFKVDITNRIYEKIMV